MSISKQADIGARYAVYLGGGVYVQSVDYRDGRKIIKTGSDVPRAMCVSRRIAIAVLHSVRADGMRAWIVNHADCGVAA